MRRLVRLLKFTTESGAEYLFDKEGQRLIRLEGPHNPGIQLPDGEWLGVTRDWPIVVGQFAIFDLEGDKRRITTYVTSIEEV